MGKADAKLRKKVSQPISLSHAGGRTKNLRLAAKTYRQQKSDMESVLAKRAAADRGRSRRR
jgi:hypothetical protein